MSTAREAQEKDRSVVRAAARALERDRYLAALLAPVAVRDDLIALAAFAGEIARIPAVVSEPMIGEIRLQWWRDVLCDTSEAGQAASGHPIADATAAVLRRRHLPTALFEQLIDAQVRRLGGRTPEAVGALEAHAAAWDGGQFELAWRVLGGEGAAPAVLIDAGRIYGLARAIAAAPGDLGGLLVQAEADLDSFAKAYQSADGRARQAALPVAVVRPYLKASQRMKPFPPAIAEIGPLARIWRIWRASRTGRV